MLLLCINQFTFAQRDLNTISEALRKGNVSVLSNFFDEMIDISFSDKTTNYSKTQAEMIIKNFFSKCEPIEYKLSYIGTSNTNNTKYAIGNLTTSKGQYRVYMFFKPKANDYILQELRFEK